MIVLPKGAFMLLPDKAAEKTAGGIILDADTKEVPDTGVIKYAGKNIAEYIGTRVRFRYTFGELIKFEGKEYLYFRDLESSMYYIIK